MWNSALVLVDFVWVLWELTERKLFMIPYGKQNCLDNLTRMFICVYGSPYEDGKLEFIQELDSLLENWLGPQL